MTRLTISVAAGVFAFLCAAWLCWGIYSIRFAFWAMGTGSSIQDVGSWGDSFGPYSAIISAVGFAMVVATLAQQIIVTKQQQADLHRQRFESTFFQLLDMLRAARSEVRFRQSLEYLAENSPKRKVAKLETGPDAFRSAMFELRFWLRRAEADLSAAAEKKFLSALYFTRIHERYESTFGPYFRLLYTILWRLREDHVLTSEEKRRYANLLRGHLTSFEVGLSGFNGLMPRAKDFDALIVQFRLLKYHPDGTVRDRLKKVYPPEAFLGRDEDGTDEFLEQDPLDKEAMA